MDADFDKHYANKVSKAQFIKQHSHIGSEIELGEEWEKLQVHKPKEKPEKGK